MQGTQTEGEKNDNAWVNDLIKKRILEQINKEAKKETFINKQVNNTWTKTNIMNTLRRENPILKKKGKKKKNVKKVQSLIK